MRALLIRAEARLSGRARDPAHPAPDATERLGQQLRDNSSARLLLALYELVPRPGLGDGTAPLFGPPRRGSS